MAREYKDSGIKWIGQIPKEWRIGKIKNFYSLQTGFTPDTKNVMYYDEQGALWANIADIGREHYIDDTKKKISNLYISKYNPNIVPKGSLLYSFKLSVGSVAIAAKDMYINEAIAAFIKKDGISLSFLYYSSQVCIIFNANENIYGAKILNQDLINNAIIIFPPLLIQQKIADYLDKVCGEADEMIALQEKMIEELKAYKQSIITEAVTKGLNPNVPMKNSGIDWIGEIPEHWKMQRLRTLGWTQNGISQSGDYFGKDYAYPFISYSDAYKNYSILHPEGRANSSLEDRKRYSLIEGDVLFTRTSETIEEIGFSSTCLETIKDAVYSGFLIRFRPTSKNLFKGFSKYYFRSQIHRAFFVKQMNIVTRASLGQDLLKNLLVLLPSLSEQRQIASYLDSKCSEIDSLIAIKQQKITELKEYKKSVIYEYVTGKKEVV